MPHSEFGPVADKSFPIDKEHDYCEDDGKNAYYCCKESEYKKCIESHY